MSPLHHCARLERPDLAIILLQRDNSRVNATNAIRETPRNLPADVAVHISVDQNCPLMVQLLLRFQADVNAQNGKNLATPCKPNINHLVHTAIVRETGNGLFLPIIDSLIRAHPKLLKDRVLSTPLDLAQRKQLKDALFRIDSYSNPSYLRRCR